MDRAVDAMSDACDDFINAATDFLLTRAASDGLRTPESDVAMQGFKDKWELFKETCDRAEDLVDAAHHNLVGELASVGIDEFDDYDFYYEDNVENWQIVELSNADDSTSDIINAAAAAASPLSTSQTPGNQAPEDAAAEFQV
ncbi:Mediator of RNA polymerase II transcription subunit 32 [Dendrobium catenatum]|uniref:Mediator of RNA polymerase II transcription subunit 32 n=1 Tax=Dendrobium catenatum TaxID=906689 RepID=A0A2I0WJN9_9ASPA|nr:Mediator of RNA polymerase II transcription subunit 32 [Dendrobium catenatum]